MKLLCKVCGKHSNINSCSCGSLLFQYYTVTYRTVQYGTLRFEIYDNATLIFAMQKNFDIKLIQLNKQLDVGGIYKYTSKLSKFKAFI